MLQSELTGKAAEVYSAFGVAESSDYEHVKSQNNNYSKSSYSCNKSILESQSSTGSKSSPQGGSRSGPGRFEGVVLLLGNDLAGGKVEPDPRVCERVTSSVTSDEEDDDLYPACAVTRAIARRQEMEADHSTDAVTKDSSTEIDLNDTLISNIDDYKTSTEPQNTRKIVKDTPLPRVIGNDDKLNLPSKQENDILSREQLLAEQHTDPDIIQLDKRAVPPEEMVGKRNQKIPSESLQPIPAFEEPFSRVLVDCVGLLPRTRSGNQYLLTIMCTSTRFPEAIPLRNIKAKTIVKF
uniref:Uncharacterized protein n=1 Tax=Magallana gigas TaxID=29159 RepID=A0A8W8M3J6_MAGGI